MKDLSQSPPPMMTAPEVWKRLGISRPTFFRLKREGKIPPGIRVGDRAIRWERTAIESWLQSRTVEAK